MLAEERKSKIIELVNKEKIVKVFDLSQKFNTTEVTIRRDLLELEKRKKLRRVHGGAISLNPRGIALNRNDLAILCKEEKIRIARAAYGFINDSDALMFDASTTVQELAKLISEGDRKNLSVITNSFNVVNILSTKSDIHVIHTGGQVSYNMNYSTGVLTESMIRNLRVEKCFIGSNGVDDVYGYSVPTFEDASVKRSMIKAASETFVLADHTKFGDTYMAKFAEFSGDIDYLISDVEPTEIDIDLLKANVNFIVAE